MVGALALKLSSLDLNMVPLVLTVESDNNATTAWQGVCICQVKVTRSTDSFIDYFLVRAKS